MVPGIEEAESRLRMPMNLSKELLKIIVCPVCKTALEYRPNDQVLVCLKCRRHYAIVNDVPNLLADQAKITP